MEQTRLEQLEAEVERLTNENAALRKRLAASNKRLATYEAQASRRLRYESDYVPYGDEEYDR